MGRYDFVSLLKLFFCLLVKSNEIYTENRFARDERKSQRNYPIFVSYSKKLYQCRRVSIVYSVFISDNTNTIQLIIGLKTFGFYNDVLIYSCKHLLRNLALLKTIGHATTRMKFSLIRCRYFGDSTVNTKLELVSWLQDKDGERFLRRLPKPYSQCFQNCWRARNGQSFGTRSNPQRRTSLVFLVNSVHELSYDGRRLQFPVQYQSGGLPQYLMMFFDWSDRGQKGKSIGTQREHRAREQFQFSQPMAYTEYRKQADLRECDDNAQYFTTYLSILKMQSN